MIKRRVFISIFLILLQVGIVSARIVEYDLYPNVHDFKDIQQSGNILTDDNVLLNELNYIIDTNFNGNTIITKYTNLEKKIIDRFGYEWFNKLIQNRYIGIGGSKYRFAVSNKPYLYGLIKIEDKKELKTNLKHEKLIRISSSKDQNITLRFYSISPNYFTGDYSFEEAYMIYNSNIIEDDKKIITLYDTTQEYYNLSGYIKSNMTSLGKWHSVSDEERLKRNENTELNIEKKYELIEFKRKIPNGEYWISKSYVPYYEISFDVSKGENDLYLNYESYQFPNQPLQIK